MAQSEERKNYKAPPAYYDGENYSDWKLDIDLWQEFTSLEKKKQGTAFLLELKPGKVKDAVRSLGKEVLVAENGLTQIINQLDKIYQEDAAQLSYRVYSKFEKYSRPDSMSLQSYISEFEKLLADLKKQKITLPEEVLAYRFLNSANLPAEKTDLALATVQSLTYKEMCKTINKIFSVQANFSRSEMKDELSVKVEPEECHYVDHHRRGGGTIHSRPQAGSSHYPYRGRTTDYSGCYVCGEKDHSARACSLRKDCRPNSHSVERFEPEVYDQYLTHDVANNLDGVQVIPQMETDDTAYMTFMVTSVDPHENCFVNNLGSLVYDTLACAVIDSGCTKTVVGRNWINLYRDTLEEDQLKMMTSERCATPFRFGDGVEVMSFEKVKIPGCIGRKRVLIEANIVNKDLPLLLSKASLKKAGAMLDFKNDKIVFDNESVDLCETKSKHYCVPLCIKRRLFIGDKKPCLVLTLTEETMFERDPQEIKKKVENLHKQLSHPHKEDLKSLLKSKGFSREDFMQAIDNVSENCAICVSYKQETEKLNAGKRLSSAFRSQKTKSQVGIAETYSIGETVMYRRKGSLKWWGPGVVLAKDSNCYLLKHGNRYYKCGTGHMTRVPSSRKPEELILQRKMPNLQKQPELMKQRNYLELGTQEAKRMCSPGLNSDDTKSSIRDAHNKVSKTGLPKAKSYVKFLPKYSEDEGNSTTWMKAFIHSRAGKAAGKYSNCLNVQLDGYDDINCVDWHELAVDWKEVDEAEREEVMLSNG